MQKKEHNSSKKFQEKNKVFNIDSRGVSKKNGSIRKNYQNGNAIKGVWLQ